MIGKLTGKVDSIGESHCILDVNGVGYEVHASARTLRALEVGAVIALTIDTHVREDAIRLYGFSSEVERTWFRTLQGVQGVGAKVALACLGVVSSNDLANAIALGDWASIERTPGIGKKLAQRIVAELKEKAPQLSVAAIAADRDAGKAIIDTVAPGAIPGADAAAAEAISALTNLGYLPVDAVRAVAVAHKELGADAATAELIRGGLKALARQ